MTQPTQEQGMTLVATPSRTLSSRVRIEHELKELRRRLADAWWYERSLEEIQEIERMIAARAAALRASA